MARLAQDTLNSSFPSPSMLLSFETSDQLVQYYLNHSGQVFAGVTFNNSESGRDVSYSISIDSLNLPSTLSQALNGNSATTLYFSSGMRGGGEKEAGEEGNGRIEN